MSLYAEALAVRLNRPTLKSEPPVSPYVAQAAARVATGWAVRFDGWTWLTYRVSSVGVESYVTPDGADALAFYLARCKEALS